ncbi:MAG: DoxX family protein [Thaumarchaeota archaeon]|nr:DoxX family protein [Nitrososphaerota archaeon]
MATAEVKTTILNDIASWGVRAVIGVVFIVHGYGKLANEGFAGWLPSLGIPSELAMLIILAEIIPGIFMIVGVLTRISASVISIIMVGAIFHVKGAANFTGEGAIEFDLILLAASLLVIVAGPGRASIAHIVKKIPRPLH